LHLVLGGTFLPHPEKAHKGGEDAFFADDAIGAFGVADGVGGSASFMVDPGEFSRSILRSCHAGLLQKRGRGLELRRALQYAGSKESSLPGGSSTVLLGQLEPGTNVLRFLNLGDSGAFVFRPSMRRFPKTEPFLWPRVLTRSHDQTHYFNCPYQVAAEDFALAAAEADELQTIARSGDIVVAATDGVLDNLFVEQIQVEVAKRVDELFAEDPLVAQAAANGLAKSIADEALAVGHRQDEPGLQTPFAVSAAKEGYSFAGGKLDDVAVVCGVVRHGQRPPEQRLSNFDFAS
jgi:protein phosphatase PTC7